MARGKLEVLLVGAKGLENTDFLSDMDTYVIVTYRSNEQKSSVTSGSGSELEWNETFQFAISGDDTELVLKIMDSDAGTEDDFVGEAKIPIEPVFLEGSVPVTTYRVVKDEEFEGEIRVGLTFTPEEARKLLRAIQVRRRRRAMAAGTNLNQPSFRLNKDEMKRSILHMIHC